jgi:phosphoserine phosphatase RsbU/P
MFNKSIAYRLSIFISLAVTIVFIVFIIILFYFNQRLLRENIENRAISLSSVANSKISRNILTAREVTMNVAEQIIYYNEHNNVGVLLSMVMEKYKFLNAIYIKIDSVIPNNTNYYITREKNDSIIFQESSQIIYSCPKEKEILEEIFKTPKTGWTDPFKCNTNGNILVSFYCPIEVRDKSGNTIHAGYVISELSLYELNKIINRIKTGENEYAFIINKNGDYITHPNSEYILERNINSIPDDVLDIEKIDIKALLSGEKSGSFIAYPEVFNYEKSWVYYTPINQNRWILIFVMTYNELFKELYLLTLGMLVFAMLAIAAICIIIKYISNKLIEPLSLLTTQLNKLTTPFSKEKLKTRNEVKQISNSLYYLRSQFERYKEEQAAEQKKSLRRRQDMLQAIEIQQSLIKTDFSAFNQNKDIDLHAIYKPVSGVSGDLFDYFFIDDENIVFTIGDVSGKGVSAALFMSIAQVIIKKNAYDKKANIIVKNANKDLFTTSGHQYFLTLFLGVLNVKKGELNYCNAAHTTSFILKSNGNITELNKFHGLPLGLYPDSNYSDTKIKLEKGDSIILYTDGVTELENAENEQFGKNRLKEKIHKLSPVETKASKMVSQLEKSLVIFRGKTLPKDDICLFIIKLK